MDCADTLEEQAILGHREVDARRSEHALAQKTHRRDGYTRGDCASTEVAQRLAHHFRRGRCGSSETVCSQNRYVDNVGCEVKHNNSHHAEYQSAWQVPARLLDFTRDERRCLPAAVGKDHWHECGAKGCQEVK